MSELLQYLGLGLAALAAGAINSIAGGGSLLSFPALIAFGQPAAIANATNNAAVWPGTLSSSYAYRKDFPRDRAVWLPLILSSLLGGTLGAAILVGTPPALFQKLTPFLVVVGTTLFAAREFFSRIAKKIDASTGTGTVKGRMLGFAFQLMIATYGGYFGAGAGMLMLGALSLMGLGDIHKMNALKTVLASVFNGIALVYFAVAGLVVWPVALGMGVCAITGGYLGAKSARRLNQHAAQRLIVIMGYSAALWLFYKNYL